MIEYSATLSGPEDEVPLLSGGARHPRPGDPRLQAEGQHGGEVPRPQPQLRGRQQGGRGARGQPQAMGHKWPLRPGVHVHVNGLNTFTGVSDSKVNHQTLY